MTFLAQRLVTKYSSILQLVRERRPLLTYSLTGRRPYFFPFTLLFSFFTSLSPLPSCLVKINLNSLPGFLGRNYSQTKLSWRQILLTTEPTYPLLISHQMILLVIAKTERIRRHSSINTQRTAILIHSLATTNYPISPRRKSPPLSSHHNSGV